MAWTPGLLVLPMAVAGASRIPEMLDSGWGVVGYLLSVLYVALAVGIVWQFVTQRPVLVVDRRGIHRGRRRFMGWNEIGSIGHVSGPKMARQFSVMPKDVWAKDLVVSQQHVNDLQSFRAWLDELLAEYRSTSSSTT